MNINFSKIPLKCTHIKIDIGLSYNAWHSEIWLDKEDDLVVIGIEPEPNSIECIKTGIIDRNKIGKLTTGKPFNTKYIEDNRFILLPYAIDNVDKLVTKKMYIEDGDVGTSSLYEFNNSTTNFSVREIVDVKVINLKMLFDIFPWDKFQYIDYIKVDTQGADLNVLKSAGNYLKDKVVYVTVEADGHQYKDSAAFLNEGTVFFPKHFIIDRYQNGIYFNFK